MPSLAEIKALMEEQERRASELRDLFLATQQAEEERVRKEEEERVRKEAEEKARREKEAEEKRLAEEARIAELARKAEEDRKKKEEDERVRKAAEESEKNRVDINMEGDCEWSRLSPLSTSWYLLSLAAKNAEQQPEQPKASGSKVRARSKTPAKKHSAPSMGELPIPCYTCVKRGEPGKCARTG